MRRYRCAQILCALFVCNSFVDGATSIGGANAAVTQGRVRPASPAPKWHLAETPNFRVYCCAGQIEANRLADRCESLRRQLASVWLGSSQLEPWPKPCDVVVFPTRTAYLQVVGREAAQTAGSALILTEGARVKSRRIDLRGDLGRDMESALAHELTHVVIADRLDRSRIPAWADEGMAVLADSPEKQALHLEDLRQGWQARQTFRTGELLTLLGYPQPNRMGVFYGQACSLVNFLVVRENPEQFVRFLEVAQRAGYDAALRELYGIADVAQLEQLWQKSLTATQVRFASYLRSSIWDDSLPTSDG